MCDIDLYHNEIGKIIVENIKKYNHDNSSITNSDLKAIIDSIEYLMVNYNSDYHQCVLLMKEEFDLMYKRYLRLLSKLFISDNVFYNDTIKYGLKGFFRSYNYIYSAKDRVITADYPTYLSADGEGIKFVREYLDHIIIENDFLNHFDHHMISELLLTYDVDYHNMPINIFSYVLLHVLGCLICHKPLYTLDKNDITYLKQILNNEENIKRILKKYIFILAREYKLSKRIYRYITKGYDQLVAMLLYHDINKVFLIITKHKFLKLYPSQLTDIQFNKIITEINDNNYLDILNDLISIYDVIDIMNECLNDKQRQIYIEQLDDDSKEMIIKMLDNSI
ncbi:MAG: DUF6179 domain-containing protein [Firmicutes bacterium]|nr:DUF6179 domain-containing protein [Bacillota bacterium]